MAMSDKDVLETLRAMRAARPSAAGTGRKRGTRLAAAATPTRGPSRRSDVEVAHAVLMLETALSSESFQAALGREASATIAVAAASPGSSFCEIYEEVAEYIPIVVETLEWLPVPYAATVAKVVELLQKFANKACGL
jgi:hypothetical protein